MPFKSELEIVHDERKGLVFETKKEKNKKENKKEDKAEENTSDDEVSSKRS